MDEKKGYATMDDVPFQHKPQSMINQQSHDELIEAIKEAGKQGATIIADGHNIQIQQNAVNSTQTINQTDCFDYDMLETSINEIKSYYDMPQFLTAFGDNVEDVKRMVEELHNAVALKESPSRIQKIIKPLYDLAFGAGGSLIATGICALLKGFIGG